MRTFWMSRPWMWLGRVLVRVLPAGLRRRVGLPAYYHDGGPAPFRGPSGPHW